MKGNMSVIALIVVLLFLAGILWLVNTKIPNMNATIRWIINAVIIVVAVALVLMAFGVWDQVREVKVPKI